MNGIRTYIDVLARPLTEQAKPASFGKSRARLVRACFDRVHDRRAELNSALSMRMTAKRIVVLVLVYDGPLGASDLAATIRDLSASNLFLRVRKLRHRDLAHRYLHQFARCGVLQRAKRDERVFLLRRGVRAKLRPILDPLMGTAR